MFLNVREIFSIVSFPSPRATKINPDPKNQTEAVMFGSSEVSTAIMHERKPIRHRPAFSVSTFNTSNPLIASDQVRIELENCSKSGQREYYDYAKKLLCVRFLSFTVSRASRCLLKIAHSRHCLVTHKSSVNGQL